MPRADARRTRQTIAAAAARCFAQVGYQAAGTAQIAAEAGVSEGTIFNHFPTKQALLVAALELGRGEVTAFLDAGPPHEARSSSLGGADPMQRFVHRASELVLNPAFTRSTRLASFAIALADDPEVGDALRHGRDELRQYLSTAFREAQAQGGVRRDIPAEHVADIALGFSHVAAIELALDPVGAPERMRALIGSLVLLIGQPVAEGTIDA